MNCNQDSIILNQLFSSLSQIEGVGIKRAKLYKNLGINCIRDLLLLIPLKIIQRKIEPSISEISQGDHISKTVTVKKLDISTYRGSSKPSKILCESNGEAIELTYFNSPSKVLAEKFTLNQNIIVCGIANLNGNILEIVHPSQIVAANESFKINEFEPIYPATRGLHSRFIHLTIKKVLTKLPIIQEWLPDEILLERKWPSFNKALQIIHSPKNLTDVHLLKLAIQRLALDELLCHQIKLYQLRTATKAITKQPLKFTGQLKNKMLDELNFKLTNAQIKVIKEIEEDFKNTFNVSRLIQGDVGSGKTIVALALILNVIEAGFQAALMVPTEILALQHYKNIVNLVSKFNINCTLLIGNMTSAQKREAQTAIQNGSTHIIIGTHALFQEKVNYHNLRLVIIDEQHRFGVEQRQQLQAKGNSTDLIMMTATPIPRTLEMVNYGDMDISVIDEEPSNRKNTITPIISHTKIHELEDTLNSRIMNGEQIYWVCPLIEETEKLDLAHVEDRFNSLNSKYNALVGLIHGRMNKKERESVMQNFTDGVYKIIVATTVIEVGVDVKDATIMIIENAERFGLSQLHQLRGRVGRGDKQSHCLLIYGKNFGKTSQQRLKILKESNDGFYIANEDLKLRGAGDIVGKKQSGMIEFKVFDLDDINHTNLLNTAFNLARSGLIPNNLVLKIFSS